MQEHSDGGGCYAFQGHRIWYRREGTGPPLVLFPDAVASDRLWDYQIEHFRTSHDVLALNPLGLGLSDRPPAAYPLELYVGLLERFIDDLGLAPAVLIGNCIGSLASLHTQQFATPWTRRTRLRLGRCSATPQPAGVPRPRLRQRQLRATRPRPAPGAPAHLLAMGDQNRILPLQVGQRMAQIVKPTEVHVVPGAGHALARERPDEVNQIIDQFLARYDPARGGTAATAALAR